MVIEICVKYLGHRYSSVLSYAAFGVWHIDIKNFDVRLTATRSDIQARARSRATKGSGLRWATADRPTRALLEFYLL